MATETHLPVSSSHLAVVMPSSSIAGESRMLSSETLSTSKLSFLPKSSSSTLLVSSHSSLHISSSIVVQVSSRLEIPASSSRQFIKTSSRISSSELLVSSSSNELHKTSEYVQYSASVSPQVGTSSPTPSSFLYTSSGAFSSPVIATSMVATPQASPLCLVCRRSQDQTWQVFVFFFFFCL